MKVLIEFYDKDVLKNIVAPLTLRPEKVVYLYDSGLRDGAQAEDLLRQISAQRGDVRIWLGNTAGAAGLRAFLAAAQAENRCLALTETLA